MELAPARALKHAAYYIALPHSTPPHSTLLKRADCTSRSTSLISLPHYLPYLP